MFDDDVYDLSSGSRWTIRSVEGGFRIFDTESDVMLRAVYASLPEAHEICGILNQYEIEIGQLTARLDNGQHGANDNGR